MLPNDLLRPDLCRFCKWNLIAVPWCLYHPLRTILHMPADTLNQIPHTVNQLHICRHILIQLNRCRFPRNKLRLRCHDRFSLCRLRQFINHPLFACRLLHAGQHHQIHKTLDKRRFSGSDRSHNPKINITTGSCCDILINIFICHIRHSPLLLMNMRHPINI